jgi:hypothetical protein
MSIKTKATGAGVLLAVVAGGLLVWWAHDKFGGVGQFLARWRSIFGDQVFYLVGRGEPIAAAKVLAGQVVSDVRAAAGKLDKEPWKFTGEV